LKTFKILSFDGGGIRGALSIEILYRLTLKYPNLLDEIDLFAGTSTGSIIAALLSNGNSVNDIRHLYSIPVAKKIFTPSRFNLFKPKFSNENLKEIIGTYFLKDFKIKDLKRKILIPAFDIEGENKHSWHPVFFNNFYDSKTLNIDVRDAVLASSSAPIYFPSHESYIDGGVVANSPTALSLCLAYSTYKYKYNLNNFRILSIGAGDIPDKINGKNKNWGIVQWALSPLKLNSPLFSLLMDGMSNLETFYCNELLNENFHRINPKVFKLVSLSEYKYIPYLKALATNYDLSSTYNFIENNFLK